MAETEDGGARTFKTSTALKSMELKLKVGETFEETTVNGRELPAPAIVHRNKFITGQNANKEGKNYLKRFDNLMKTDEQSPRKFQDQTSFA